MEAADRDGHAQAAELAADVERARKLIRLNPDQSDHAAVGDNAPRNRGNVDDGVALVVDLELDVDLVAKDMALSAFLEQSVDAGQAVRRDGRAAPLDDITVVVVMRRFDQNDPEPAFRHPALMEVYALFISSFNSATALERPGQLQSAGWRAFDPF